MTTTTTNRVRFIPLDEAYAEMEIHFREVQARRQWGHWQLNTTALTLEYCNPPGCCKCELDLELLDRPAKMLWWIYTIHEYG